MEAKNFNNQEMSSVDIGRYLEFSLGDERYAVPLLSIKEVIPLPETTSLPNSPDYFIGIMNLRGQIISIVDLRKKLKITKSTKRIEEAVVIVDFEGLSIGLIVDSIERVIAFAEENLSEVTQIKSQLNVKYIRGIFKDKDSLTVILDLFNVLNVGEIKAIMKK